MKAQLSTQEKLWDLRKETDTEIYVDGIATMQIKNMHDWPDAILLWRNADSITTSL